MSKRVGNTLYRGRLRSSWRVSVLCIALFLVSIALNSAPAQAHVVTNNDPQTQKDEMMVGKGNRKREKQQEEEEDNSLYSKWRNLKGLTDESDVLDVIEEVDAIVSNDEKDEKEREKVSELLSSKLGRRQVQDLVERGMYTAAEQLVALYRSQGIELSSAVFQSISVIRKRLSALADALTKRSIPRIAPAFQWAQSPEDIFLNVKFAHKFDTPSTLGCETEKMVIRNRKFTYEAKCKEKRKIFSLDLNLYDALDNESSTWSMASVGRAMFTLKKQTTSPWPRLLKSNSKPGNMHVWWDMKAQYESSMRDFEREQANQTKKDEPEEENEPDTAASAADKPNGDTTEASLTKEEENKAKEEKDRMQKQIELEQTEIDKELRANISEVDREAKEERSRIEEKLSEQKADAEARASEKRRYYRQLAADKKEEVVRRLKNETTTEDQSASDESESSSDETSNDKADDAAETESREDL
eukprot:gb/GECG01006135.1/.p1 GENE.gb/GECG01006135.1/~~gb/GECG01006135.1/.p1  ORF type:complete len:472 (+),score=90.99 gb/GECG01006135.1/:1-1416(+)